MDPVIFEFLGGLLVGAMGGLMVVLRTRHLAPPKTMPMLEVRKTRSHRSLNHRKTSPRLERERTTMTFVRRSRKAKTKIPQVAPETAQTPDIPIVAMSSFDTCPSCGLQAPGSLLAEHFLGSPSHRNGPPKIVKAEAMETKATGEAKDDDSKQSVRSLLQMLVPPRAFGRRHEHRTVSPISQVVKQLDPPHRRYP